MHRARDRYGDRHSDEHSDTGPGHAYADVVFGKYRPDRFFFQHVCVGSDTADHEASDTVLFRSRAGKERAVDSRAVGR